MAASQKISQVTAATSIASTDKIPVVSDGDTKSATPPLILDAAPRWRRSVPRIVGTRPTPWGSQEAYGTITCATSRTRHRVTRNCTNIRLVYSGLKSLSTFAVPSELGIGNAWECKASIHLISSGTTEEAKIPVTFNGRRLALVPNGGLLISDPISVDLPADKEFFVYTFANRLDSDSYSEAGGEVGLLPATVSYWPRESTTRNYDSSYDAGVGSQLSTSTGIDPFTLDKTDGAYADLTVGNQATCGPIAIIGDELSQTGQPAVALIGDSILAGAGDRPRTDFTWAGRGYFDQFLSGQCPAFQASLGGDGAAYKIGVYSYNFHNRFRFVEMCDIAYVALGTNDLVAGTALATIQSALTTLATQLKARGVRKVILATALPRTTSTDGWQTLANQTVVATNDFTNQRALFNAWVLTVPSPFDAVIDIRSGAEDLATGKWKEPPTGLDATTTTGSSTTVIQIGSPTLVANAHIGKQLIVAGEARQIIANTTSAITVLSAYSGAPSTGVAVKILDTFTFDGVHPSAWGHKWLGAILTANASVFTV